MIIYKNMPINDITPDIIENIAYGKYIHNWLESHGMSLLDVINKLHELQKESPYISDTSIKEIYDTFLYEIGFGSNIYNTKEEFLNEEFLDEMYMRELLSEEEFKAYSMLTNH